MFMLKSTMELIKEKDKKIDALQNLVIDYKETVRDLELKVEKLDAKLERANGKADWEVEKIKSTVKKDMQKKLIESDLKRVEAVAKLNTYIDMDTKDERKKMSGMLEEAIKSLGKQKVTINNKE